MINQTLFCKEMLLLQKETIKIKYRIDSVYERFDGKKTLWVIKSSTTKEFKKTKKNGNVFRKVVKKQKMK